tara:strand:- start:611 stop:1048 length:438 start_codon:yes stop_codon:yes gene_type:complete
MLDPNNITQDSYQDIIKDIGQVARDPNEVANQLSEISGLYGYYYGIMIKAKRLLDNAEGLLESFKASSRNTKREEGVPSNQRRLTAVAADDYVNSLEETEKLNQEVLRLKECYGYAKGICGTLDMKKDMLVQLSANSRQESKLYQ